MKRIFTFGLMLASVFALTNCTEELVDPTIPKDEVTQETTTPEGEGIPFQIYASLGTETKTVGSVSADGTLKTAWESGDKINVFHAEAGTSELVDDGLFKISNVDQGLFDGFLKIKLDPDTSYDWYFVYVYASDGEVIDISDPNATVAIGASTQTQVQASDSKHISKANCPMYGVVKSISGSISPRVQMTHMAALFELSILNNTKYYTLNPDPTKGYPVPNWLPGPVYIESLKLKSIASHSMVGTFTTNLTSVNKAVDFKTTKESSSSEVEVVLPAGGVSIDVGRTETFYFALAPFTAAANTLVLYVNGTDIKIPLASTFSSGNVTRMTLKVHELTHAFESDAKNLMSQGNLSTDQNEYVLYFSKPDGTIAAVHDIEPQSAVINGQNVPIYVIGKEGTAGTIRISGFAKEMINALPIGFYTSSWNDKQTAMTVNKIDLLLPRYNEIDHDDNWLTAKVTNYNSIKERPSISSLNSLIQTIGTIGSVVGKFELDIDLSNALTRDLLTKFVNPQTITFNQVLPNGRFKDEGQSNVIVLDENGVHKDMDEEKVEGFISMFSARGYTASLAGFKSILNSEFSSNTYAISWDDVALNTGRGIYYKIYDKMYEVFTKSMGLSAEIAEFAIPTVFYVLFYGETKIFSQKPSEEELISHIMHCLRDMKCIIDIVTCPYAKNKADYGTNGAPKMPTTTIQPMVVWGLDGKGASVTIPDPSGTN